MQTTTVRTHATSNNLMLTMTELAMCATKHRDVVDAGRKFVNPHADKKGNSHHVKRGVR